MPEDAWEAMRAGIEAQVPFLQQAPETLYRQVSEALPPTQPPPRLYLVGCGDSWYAGLATQLAVEAWSGVPTRALESLEFSRYHLDLAPSGALVVALSNSGRVSRTVEAALRARRRGLRVLAATGDLTSPVAEAADAAVDLAYAERRFGPGTSSYLASLTLFYALGLRLAFLAGRLSRAEVEGRLAALAARAEALKAALRACEARLAPLARGTPLEARLLFLGAGPNLGTALFSAAKVVEAAGVPAGAQELEEWAHIDFFTADERALTFLLAPPGAALDRAREQLQAMAEMGLRRVVVCHPDDEETAGLAEVAVLIAEEEEWLSPLTYLAPGEVFALHFGRTHGRTPFGFDDPKRRELNRRQIYESRLLTEGSSGAAPERG